MTFDEIMACEALKRQQLAEKVKNLLIDVEQKEKSEKEIRYTPHEVYDILMKYGVDL